MSFLNQLYNLLFVPHKKIVRRRRAVKRNIISAPRITSDKILLHGEFWTLDKSTKHPKKPILDFENKIIRTSTNLLQRDTQLKWYKTYAKQFLTARTLQLQQEKNALPLNKIIIRDTKTRRGTCSTHKNIGLNRRLVKMPPFPMDYVICHELSHLEQMNHSAKFRAVVDRMIDNKKEAIHWLKVNGRSLY